MQPQTNELQVAGRTPKPQLPIPTELVKVIKRCTGCGCELRNDTYGQRCEDCFADNVGNIPTDRRRRLVEPLPPDPAPERLRIYDADDDD